MKIGKLKVNRYAKGGVLISRIPGLSATRHAVLHATHVEEASELSQQLRQRVLVWPLHLRTIQVVSSNEAAALHGAAAAWVLNT